MFTVSSNNSVEPSRILEDAQPFTGPDRRRNRRSTDDDALALMVEEAVAEEMAKFQTALIHHIDTKFGQLHKILQDHVDEAFPPGPLHKHKEYHQARIDGAETAKKIKGELWLMAAKGMVVFVLSLFGLGVLAWLKGVLAA